jgi:hypothetical protein
MPRIDQIFAFIVADAGPDDEGIAGFLSGQGWLPMVAADSGRVDSLRAIAQRIANQGKPVALVKFSVREVVEVIGPETKA